MTKTSLGCVAFWVGPLSMFSGAKVPCFSGDGFTCRPSKCTADTVYSPQLRASNIVAVMFRFGVNLQTSCPRLIVPYSASGTKPDPIIARDVSPELIFDKVLQHVMGQAILTKYWIEAFPSLDAMAACCNKL